MLITSPGLWRTLEGELRRKGRKRIAVAYVSSPQLLHLRLGDELIANVSEAAVRTGQTDAKALLRLCSKGVAVFTHPRLHAKVFALPHCAIVGSANASVSSQLLVEAAVLDRSQAGRKAAAAWFRSVLGSATRLTTTSLRALADLPVVRMGGAQAMRLPSLLDALRDAAPVLNQLRFAVFTLDATLSKSRVTKAGRTAGLLTNDLGNGDWSWAQFSDKAGLSSRLRQAFGGQSTITFLAEADDHDTLTRFVGIEGNTFAYIGSTRIVERGEATRVTYERIQERTPGLRFGPPAWKRDLLQVLNAGLRSNRRLAARIGQRDTCQMFLSELTQLYALGLGSLTDSSPLSRR